MEPGNSQRTEVDIPVIEAGPKAHRGDQDMRTQVFGRLGTCPRRIYPCLRSREDVERQTSSAKPG